MLYEVITAEAERHARAAADEGMRLSQKEAALLQAAASSSDMNSIWRSLGVDPTAQAPDDMTCLTVRRDS